MKGTLPKLILVTIVCGICLWFAVKWFVGGTDDLASTIDLRSLAHLREGYQSGNEPGIQERSTNNKITEPVSVGLQRLDRTPNPPAKVPDEQQEEEQEEESSDEDSENEEDPEYIIEEDLQENEAEPTANVELQDPSIDGDVSLSRRERLEQEKIKAGTSLKADEIEAREAARRKRLADLGLLPEKPPEPTIAIDASLEMPDRCGGAAIARVPIGLKFRFESSLIKGKSLNSLESLVSLYRECGEGQFILAENPLGRTDATETLIQMRFDEIKYFFIQHSVPTDAVQFPEK